MTAGDGEKTDGVTRRDLRPAGHGLFWLLLPAGLLVALELVVSVRGVSLGLMGVILLDACLTERAEV